MFAIAVRDGSGFFVLENTYDTVETALGARDEYVRSRHSDTYPGQPYAWFDVSVVFAHNHQFEVHIRSTNPNENIPL